MERRWEGSSRSSAGPAIRIGDVARPAVFGGGGRLGQDPIHRYLKGPLPSSESISKEGLLGP